MTLISPSLGFAGGDDDDDTSSDDDDTSSDDDDTSSDDDDTADDDDSSESGPIDSAEVPYENRELGGGCACEAHPSGERSAGLAVLLVFLGLLRRRSHRL